MIARNPTRRIECSPEANLSFYRKVRRPYSEIRVNSQICARRSRVPSRR